MKIFLRRKNICHVHFRPSYFNVLAPLIIYFGHLGLKSRFLAFNLLNQNSRFMHNFVNLTFYVLIFVSAT